MDLTFAAAKDRADFFDRSYCANPGDSMSLYRCYGALIDPILKHLYGGLPSRQFVIALPIEVGGRTHFLQIAFSSRHNEVSLAHLWDSWMPIHNVMWTPEMRFFLREQLRRIQILAFQTEIKSALTKTFINRAPTTHEEFQREFRDALYGSIYHLLPVVLMTTGSQSYGYYPYTYGINPGGSELPVGFRWRASTDELGCTSDMFIPSKRDRWEIVPRDGLIIQVVAPYNFAAVGDDTREVDAATTVARREPAKQLASHEARELLDEQEDFFNVFEMYLPEEKRRWMADDERCAHIVYAWASELEVHAKNEILNALNSTNWRNYLETLLIQDIQFSGLDSPGELRHWQFRFTPRSLDRYITQGFHGPGEDMTLIEKRSTLITVLGPSLLLQVSEYFETGPVIPLTHAFSSDIALRKRIAGGVEGAKGAVPQLAELHKTICDRICRLEEHQGSAWLIKDKDNQTIKHFNNFFGQEFLSQRSPRYLMKPPAVDLRDALLVKRFSIGGCDFVMSTDEEQSGDSRAPDYRFFGIDISELLKEFSVRYIQDFNRCEEWSGCEIANCKQFIHDPTEHSYHKAPWHTEGQQKTLLVHHFVVLPYKIRNMREAEDKSDLLRIWRLAGREIGELFYYDLNTTYHFIPRADDEVIPSANDEACGRFVAVTAPAKLVAEMKCTRCPKLILRFDQWK